MAAKITFLYREDRQGGAQFHRMGFWYDIAGNGGKIKNGVTPTAGDVVPQPGAINAEYDAFLSAGDRTAVAAGDAGWEIVGEEQMTETNVQFRDRMLLYHARRQTWWIQTMRDRYSRAGVTAN